jgi:hypothetical protein
MMVKAAVLAGMLALVVCAPVVGLAEDARFVRIKASEIRKVFAGREFSDEVHWVQQYLPDGKLEGASMGRKITKQWPIKDDNLCITDDRGEDCREVWKAGSKVELRRWGDDELPEAGIVRAFSR